MISVNLNICDPKLNRSFSVSHAVRSFSSVPEVTSDSDDEDKLHIVEEDRIADDPDQKSSVLKLKAARQLSDTGE